MSMQTPRRSPVGGLALLAVAVLAVALLLWNLAGPSPRSATQPTPSEASAAAQGETAAKPPAAPSPAAGTAERTAAPLPEGGMHIRGRCLAAESGAPLGGCCVDLFDAPAREESTRSSGPCRPDASTTTAADATFAFTRASAGPRTLTLYLRADGRGVATRQWYRATASDLDCGDVPLALGAVLTGRALDERGAPVERVLVHFALERQDAWRQQPVFASSGDDGTLHTKDVLPAGRWQVEVPSDHGLVRPDMLEVPPGAVTAAIDVVVRRTEELPVLSGIAVDGRGAPVPRVLLQGNRQHGPLLWTTTVGDGSFVFRRKDADEEPVRLDVPGRHRLQDPDAAYAWGTRDVQLVVLGLPTAQLRVVDARGAPVPDFAARFAGGPESRLRRLSPAQVRERMQDGALVLRELPPRRYSVSVLPGDPARGCCAPVAWELQEGAELRLALQPPAPLRVLLRRHDAPVAGSRVQVLRSESGRALRLDCPTVTLAETFAGRNPDADDGVVVDEGTTAADGSVMLHAPPGEVLAVRALGPGHAPVLQAEVAIPAGGSEHVLQVAAGATVGGRLRPRDVFERLQPREQQILAAFGPDADVARWQESRAPRLWLQEDGSGRRLPIGPPDGQRCDETGAFRIDGVPAGDWRLELWYCRGFDRRGGELRRLELAKLSLRDGEVRHLDLDVSGTQPARVDGLVLVDGLAWPDGRARLGDVEVRTGADGRFGVEVEPGRYWLELLPAGEGGRLPYCGPAVDVGGGASVDATFDMRRRSLQVRVLETDGAAAKGRLILLRGGLQVDAPPQDADGWIAIDPMPPRPVELVVYPPGFDAAARAAMPLQQRLALVTRLGPIEVAAGRQQARVELRMPPGK